jgi:hypothetical protein
MVERSSVGTPRLYNRAVRKMCFALLLCACATGCSGHRFAGMTPGEAAVETRAVVRAFAPSYLSYEDPDIGRDLILFDVSRDRDSRGRDAWLAVFRYRGGPDAACVWVRRATEGPWRYAYEETQSVANGRAPETVHDRCVTAALNRHLLSRDDVTGSEVPLPAFAYPQPVSPLGPVARGSYLADLEDSTAVSESGIPTKFPQTTAPGTAGVVAFVLDERTRRTIPGATVTVMPSGRMSGFFNRPPARPRAGSITATSDRQGAVAFLNLPTLRLGYDFVVRAQGYAPLYQVHDLSTGGLYAGDFYLARTPRFDDLTPEPPPCGTGC